MAARSWALLLSPILLTPSPPVLPACPPNLAVDSVREKAILARLSGDADASAILGGGAGVVICFGTGVEAAVTQDRVIQIDRRLPEIEAAARVLHLALHMREGSPLVGPPGVDCARWLTAAMDEEARAYAMELQILDKAGVRPTWPFVEEARGAVAGDRARVIGRWLWDHPDGGGGVPGLAKGYAARCEAEVRRGAR